jgi:hypothetical protein
MTSASSRAGLTVILFISACLLTGCPMPVARTETTSPPITGNLAWEDGSPASGLDVVASTEWSDDRCAKPAAHASTDTSGGFQLSATQMHYGVTWLVPNLDRIAPSFRLCATVHDTTRPGYRGYGSLTATAQPDSLSCVVWRWEGSLRMSCSGRAHRDVVTGGHWTDTVGERREGFYRLFLTIEPTEVNGYRKGHPQDRPYVRVQWVEPLPNAGAERAAHYRIRQTQDLTFDRNKVHTVEEVQLWRREGRWVASLTGRKKAFMNDFARTELVFALGAPGQASLIAGP